VTDHVQQPMHADEVPVDERLVRRLLRTQFPTLGALPLTIVEEWGTDNAIWRLGDDLVVRLPRIAWARGQVPRDATWLPRLAPHLPTAIPEPVAVGEPGDGYPFAWAIHRWIDGEPARLDRMDDRRAFARDLAAVVDRLQRIPTDDAPPARNRARPLAAYDEATRVVIDGAAHLIDAAAALAVWEAGLAARPHAGRPVWVHGDLEGNVLLRDGRLAGVVDWGSLCIGDPAVDVQVVWSPLFDDESRAVFIESIGVDDDTVARSRAAAINQACAALPYYLHTYPGIVERSRAKLAVLGVDPAG